MADLYQVLGVDRDASENDIKRAYRRKARELHPDAGGDEEAFKEATHAYEVLSDPQRRARYDRFGDDGTARARTGARGDPFGFGGFGDLSDVIDAFFGGAGGPFTTGDRRTRRAGQAARQAGRDVVVGVEVDLEEVISGVEREIELDAATTCDVCGGSGTAGETGLVRCSTCGGAGQVQRVVRSAFGQMATVRACPDCDGIGQVVDDPCRACGGEGRTRTRRRLTVTVPSGVEDGDRLRVANQGEAGRRGAEHGNLYVQVRVRPHEVFTRDGRDLWCDISVPMVNAALGATLKVPTLSGDVIDVDLPAGTQPGEVLTVRRAGIPRRGGHDPGDMKIRVDVEVPRAGSPEERQLLRRLAELRDEQAPPAGTGLFGRLRNAFR